MLQQRLQALQSALRRSTRSCQCCIIKEASAHDQPRNLPLLWLLFWLLMMLRVRLFWLLLLLLLLVWNRL
jgi:hypothetical protein